MSNLFVFDIDNTLVASEPIYDEAYRKTSKDILGREFLMTQTPDGEPDRTFSQKDNPTILQERLRALNIDPSTVDVASFFETFSRHAEKSAATTDAVLFDGVLDFIRTLANQGTLVALSGGPRALQTTVLERTGLAAFFDLSQSVFLGEFASKQAAIERLSAQARPSFVAHFGDAPNDMRALHAANVPAKKCAVGVTVAGYVTPKALRDAGADVVIEDFTNAALNASILN